MAGIGFELNKFIEKENYIGIISAYGFAGLICSGPWLLSIASILLLSLIARFHGVPIEIGQLFQILVVYLIAGSLVISSLFQHSYTRYLADLCYLHRKSEIVPSINGVYFILLLLSAGLGALLIHALAPSLPVQIKTLLVSSLVILSLIWVSTSVLSGILAYKTILIAFFFNFLITTLLGSYWHHFGLLGLLSSFLLGQFSLLMILIYAIYQEFPTNQLINFEFFRFKQTNKILILTGFFYNVGIWVDKFIFWYNPTTGTQLLDHIHASYVYDIPIFFAYLLAVPGMAVFLLHIETAYAEAHTKFYDYVCGSHTFNEIQSAYLDLVSAARFSIISAIKSQGFMLLIGLTCGLGLFSYCSIPLIYFPLFCVCLLAAGLTVILWATLDLIFYQDRLREALTVVTLFVFSNALFTWLSIKLGIFYYGFGLVASLFISILTAYLLLNQIIRKLQYVTYMLRN